MVDIHLLRKKIPVITELALLEEIVAVSSLIEFEHGDLLLDYGNYVRYVPIVLEGSLKVLRQSAKGDELFLYYLNEGDTCAMAINCCMMQRKSEVRSIAEDKTTVLSIPLKFMDIWMDQYTNWKNYILSSYNKRFHELFLALDSIAFLKMDERLLKYLATKSRSQNSLILQVTHQEIAHELNASREAVSRLLKKLEHKELLQLGRHKIELKKQPTELERWMNTV